MKKINSLKMALKNILHKPIRSIGLMSVVAILSFVLFSGSYISLSLSNGLDCMKERLGAELIIVPAENAEDMESILLQGTPNNFYFDKEAVKQVEEIEGVEKVTAQFFLQSLNADCCSVPIQLIGFDPETDFSVQPWIDQVYSGKIEGNSVIVGSDITIDETQTIKMFGTDYKIIASLEKTSTGLDQSVYVTFDTIEKMYEDAKSKGVEFDENVNPENSISSILIDLEDDAVKRDVMKKIYRTVSNIEVIEPQNMVLSISNSLGNISGIITIFTILFFVSSFLTLYIVFTISANERKKEFSILRVIGATKGKLMGILLKEAVIIGFIGGLLGIVLGMTFTIPFNTYIETTLGLPYIQPTMLEILKTVCIDLVIATLVGPVASIQAANQISKAETYITMKESE